MVRPIRRPSLPVVLLALIPLVLVAGTSVVLEIEMHRMTRDVAAIANIHPLAGMLSSLGILLWWSSASIWLFTAILWRSVEAKEKFRFALSSACLSAYLALDDLFQIHEMLAPTYLGVPEKAVYAVLGTAVVIYLWKFRSLLTHKNYSLLFFALFFLSASVAVDAVFEPWLWRLGHWTFLVEDGLKWCGIVNWCAFCVSACRTDVLVGHRADSTTDRQPSAVNHEAAKRHGVNPSPSMPRYAKGHDTPSRPRRKENELAAKLDSNG